MRILAVLANISGRFRFSHRIFGPTDCEVSALPQRSRISSSPIAVVVPRSPCRAGIDAVEHGIHQRLAVASTGSMQGPMALAPTAAIEEGAMRLSTQHLAADENEIAPPVLARRGARPSRAAAPSSYVGARRLRRSCPFRRRSRPSIRKCRCRCRDSVFMVRSRSKPASIRPRPASSEAGQALEVGEIADFERRMRVAQGKPRSIAATPAPTSCT